MENLRCQNCGGASKYTMINIGGIVELAQDRTCLSCSSWVLDDVRFRNAWAVANEFQRMAMIAFEKAERDSLLTQNLFKEAFPYVDVLVRPDIVGMATLFNQLLKSRIPALTGVKFPCAFPDVNPFREVWGVPTDGNVLATDFFKGLTLENIMAIYHREILSQTRFCGRTSDSITLKSWGGEACKKIIAYKDPVYDPCLGYILNKDHSYTVTTSDRDITFFKNGKVKIGVTAKEADNINDFLAVLDL